VCVVFSILVASMITKGGSGCCMKLSCSRNSC